MKNLIDLIEDEFAKLATLTKSYEVVRGKVFELEILKDVCQYFQDDGWQINQIGNGQLTFRKSGGPIDSQKFTGYEIRKKGRILQIWTDIEFISSRVNPVLKTFKPSIHRWQVHELDVVVLKQHIIEVNGYPVNNSIYFAIECKYRKFNKALLKEAIGVHTELGGIIPLHVMCSHSNIYQYAPPSANLHMHYFRGKKDR